MSKEKTQARRDHLARMRAEQKRKERRVAFLMWGVGGVVIALLIGAVGFYLVKEQAPVSLAAVTTAKYPAAEHVQTKISYKENPPLGGPHHPAWQNCGIYDQPINNENAVHSLEHGAVWITYQPDLPKDQVDRLKELASADYMLLSPYPGLPAKIVVSSWNNQLKLDNADDPRLPRFISKYKNGPDTPELGASCDGAVSTTTAEAPIPAAPSTSPSQSPAATETPSAGSSPTP
ncbi:DUF3105 domain-containing protein [Streptosporangium fragile]|uniref:DUF3105 domain-containing protein n=1 Tax=Streptosporangium fragile TaxID=46186 RepID=A0ABN3VQU1_9ACTN